MMNSNRIIEQWLNIVTQPKTLEILQEKFQDRFDSEFSVTSEENQTDCDNVIETLEDGRAVLDDGSTFKGTFNSNGLKTGKGILTSKDGFSTTEGYYHDGRLIGSVVRVLHNRRDLTFYKRGVKHGFSHVVEDGKLKAIGRYSNGISVGFWWRETDQGCYCVGTVDSNNRFRGGNVAFVYSDFLTALVGEFSGEKMIEARACEIAGITESSGILLPIFRPTNEATYSHEDIASDRISAHPLLEDPYEQRLVEVCTSLIPEAGQGLFARIPIPKGRIVAYFNGVRIHGRSAALSSDYSIALDSDTMIDIPDASTEIYRATLAHKICHSFNPNAKYDHSWHPRFGKIRCAVSIRDIEPGEEITCDYRYSMSKAPMWYKTALKKHLIEVVGLKNEQIASWMQQYENDTSEESRIR